MESTSAADVTAAMDAVLATGAPATITRAERIGHEVMFTIAFVARAGNVLVFDIRTPDATANLGGPATRVSVPGKAGAVLDSLGIIVPPAIEALLDGAVAAHPPVA